MQSSLHAPMYAETEAEEQQDGQQHQLALPTHEQQAQFTHDQQAQLQQRCSHFCHCAMSVNDMGTQGNHL
eukprot:10066337-Prorocentrum_lima.AAC.1